MLISLTLFYIIPNKLYMKMEYELDYQKKQENLQENYMDKIKGILTDKLGNFPMYYIIWEMCWKN